MMLVDGVELAWWRRAISGRHASRTCNEQKVMQHCTLDFQRFGPGDTLVPVVTGCVHGERRTTTTTICSTRSFSTARVWAAQLSLVCIGTTLIHVKLVPRQRHFRVDRPQVELPASKRAALQQAPSSATTARTPVQAMRPHVFVKHRGEWTHGTMSDSGYDIILS